MTSVAYITQANRKSRTRELQQKALAFAVAPNADALASLVIAFARVGNLDRALVFYDQIKATSRCVIHTRVVTVREGFVWEP